MVHTLTPEPVHSSDDWLLPTAIVVVVALGMGAIFIDTLEVMVSTWKKYGFYYYGHCFVIFPISVCLIWDKRHQLAQLPPTPEYRVLGLLLLAGFGWLLAYLAELHVAQQAALIACLILSAWLMLGTRVAKILAFPFGFLFFALPINTEFLTPFLVDFTADFTVILLRIIGFEVVQNGTSFLIGGRSWIVAELCSGRLHLALIITAGILFSYLMARSWRRRLLFVVFALTIPLVSNVVRTSLIVLTVELDVSYLGPLKEHEIFAEFGFWLVVASLFLLGFLFRDPPEDTGKPDAILPERPARGLGQQQVSSFVTAGFIALTAVLLWPSLVYAIDRLEPERYATPHTALQALDGVAGWKGLIDLSAMPLPETEIPADAKFHRLYVKGPQLVFMYVCQYHRLTECMTDMRHMQYVMTGGNSSGQMIRSANRQIRLGKRTVEVTQNQMDGGQGSVLTWNWFHHGGRIDSNRPLAQLRAAWCRLSNRKQDVTTIVLSTDQVKNRATGEQVLRSFAESMLPEIETALDRSLVE